MLRSTAPWIVLAALFAPACLAAGSSINAYGGVRSLDSDDFDHVDEPSVYGADVVWKLDKPMLSLEGGWLHAEDDASSSGALTDVDLGLDEYFFGLRAVPWDFWIEPYLSVGMTFVDGELDATNGGLPADESDATLGYYARLGAALRFGPVRFGLDGRATFATDIDLDTIDADLDGQQITAFIGFAY